MGEDITWEHVVGLARDAILKDNVIVIADTSIWFDYFEPMPGPTHDRDYAKEKSYLDALIKSGKLRLPKLIKDELIRTYNNKYRSYMNDETMPAGAEFNIQLKKKLKEIPEEKVDKRYCIEDVEGMYHDIWHNKDQYEAELYRWGYTKARDAYGNPIWNDLDDAGKAAFLESSSGPSGKDKDILAIAAHLKAVRKGYFVILFVRDKDFLAFSHIIYKKFGLLAVRPEDIMPD
ncbi:MAG: hypothetical protein MPJ78_18955 [Hyphomicrobiaceae bacterium]|nr:hypothetical protein [Hyphomicrobiaceae bacterium]